MQKVTKQSWPLFMNLLILDFEFLVGRRFRIGKVEGKKVIYVKCGVGLVRFYEIFDFSKSMNIFLYFVVFFFFK